MISVTAAEFQREFGRYQEAALTEPVSITSGEQRLVVMAAAEYERLKRRDRVVFKTEDLTESEIAAILQGGMDARHDVLDGELAE